MSDPQGIVDVMTKTNGYAKRDAEIEKLRTVLDDNAIALEALVERGWVTEPRAMMVVNGLVERARSALNRRKP